jgi:hypothetical protein
MLLLMILSRPAHVLHNDHDGLRVIIIIVTLISWLSFSQGLLSQGASLTARPDLALKFLLQRHALQPGGTQTELNRLNKLRKLRTMLCGSGAKTKLQRCDTGTTGA